MSDNEFECSFKEVEEWFHIDKDEEDPKRKYGYYSSTMLPVKGYGTKAWGVVAYIEVDHNLHRESGFTDDQIVEGCLKFINKPETRRHRKPRYGSKFSLNSYNMLEGNIVSVSLVTDVRNNKNFWGKGWKAR
tara:strand:+ start:1131 stop:1526 length:396 start_codon:yes stop_codon:yes gene_type:complete